MVIHVQLVSSYHCYHLLFLFFSLWHVFGIPGCNVKDDLWQHYINAYSLASGTIFMDEITDPFNSTGTVLLGDKVAISFSRVLHNATRNVTRILECNVGIIAGFQLMGKYHSEKYKNIIDKFDPSIEETDVSICSTGIIERATFHATRSYRLFQLALLFVFTLRTGLQIPEPEGSFWGVNKDILVSEIYNAKYVVRRVTELRRFLFSCSENTNTNKNEFYLPEHNYLNDNQSYINCQTKSEKGTEKIRIGICSICIYPETSDILLKDITPKNREKFAILNEYSNLIVTSLHNLFPYNSLSCPYKIENEIEGSITFPEIDGNSDGNICERKEREIETSEYHPVTHIQHAKLRLMRDHLASGNFDWVSWFDCDSIIMNYESKLEDIIEKYSNPDHDLSYDSRVKKVKEYSEEHVESKKKKCNNNNNKYELLITEEGWGLSSANWMIKSSPEMIHLLEKSHELCVHQMPLFGDQDCLIWMLTYEENMNLFNYGTDPMFLENEMSDSFAIENEIEIKELSNSTLSLLRNSRPVNPPYIELRNPNELNPKARVIPQSEINSYDALNGYFMNCSMYQNGDLLVTFPACRDSSCNELFKTSFEYAEGLYDWPLSGEEPFAHLRVFGPVNSILSR